MLPRVMMVDDDPMLLAAWRRQFHRQVPECEFVFCAGGAEALRQAGSRPPLVLFTDVRMPGMDGPTFLSRYTGSYPCTVRFAATGHSEPEELQAVTRLVHRVFSKPLDSRSLVPFIGTVVRLSSRLDRASELIGLLQWIDEFGGARWAAKAEPFVAASRTKRTMLTWLEADPGRAAAFLALAPLGVHRGIEPCPADMVDTLGSDLAAIVCLGLALLEAIEGVSRPAYGFDFLRSRWSRVGEARVPPSTVESEGGRDGPHSADLLHALAEWLGGVTARGDGRASSASPPGDFMSVEHLHCTRGALMLCLAGIEPELCDVLGGDRPPST